MALTYTNTLQVVTCCVCHIDFAMPSELKEKRLRDHKDFYCPVGHSQHFTSKSDLEKANDALAKEKHLREQAEARAEARQHRIDLEVEASRRIARRLSATQGVVTRHKKKIAAGKCPCCSAKFKDLATHMKTKHPKWDPTKEVEVRT